MPEDKSELRGTGGRQWSAATLMGPGKPLNADSLAANLAGETLVFAVADGVGLMPGSPVASSRAANAAVEAGASYEGSVDAMPALFRSVSAAVSAGLKEKGESGATTLVVALVTNGHAVIGSIGDSEVISVGIEGPGQSLLPVDHLPTRANMLLAWIDGVEQFEPHITALDAMAHRLCLVTDGVSGTLSLETIADLVRSVPVSEAAQALVQAARRAGSTDDATAIVIGSAIGEEETHMRR